MGLFRRPFADVVRRQLDLFAAEQRGLLEDVAAARERYDRAGPGLGEERYVEYLDLVEDGADRLRALRDGYGATLDDAAEEAYRRAFEQGVRKRFPSFLVELLDDGIEDDD